MFRKVVARRVWLSAACVAMLVTITQLIPHRDAAAAGTLVITQVAVGHGDAAVIEGPCGELGLIDSGKPGRAQAILDVMPTDELKWISASHYDADHIGAIVEIAARGVPVGTVYDRGGDRSAKNSDVYRQYYDWVTSDVTNRQRVEIGKSFSLCSGPQEVRFNVVSVEEDGKAAGRVPVTDENDKGVCLKIVFGEFDAATCGDVAGTDRGGRSDVESAVACKFGRVEFAKVNHHGSEYSSNHAYVSTLRARAAVISTNGRYGHPDRGVVRRWSDIGRVYQTQKPKGELVDGNVTVRTDGYDEFTVQTSTSGQARHFTMHEGSGPAPGC